MTDRTDTYVLRCSLELCKSNRFSHSGERRSSAQSTNTTEFGLHLLRKRNGVFKDDGLNNSLLKNSYLVGTV